MLFRFLGVIMAQIIPPVGVMRVRVLDHDMVSQLADVFLPEWADEGAEERQVLLDLRCPYCHSPLTEADVAGDDGALRCPDCGEWVEYSEAVDAWQKSGSHSASPPAGPYGDDFIRRRGGGAGGFREGEI